MVTEPKKPRPSSLSGPPCNVLMAHPAYPREGYGAEACDLSVASSAKENETASRPEPSGWNRTAPAPFFRGPTYTRPAKPNTDAAAAPSPSGSEAMASVSVTVVLAEALAVRGALLPDSVPDTDAPSCTAPDVFAVHGQVNATEPVSAARSALGGETVPQDTPPVTERAEGVTPITAAMPALPTCSTTLNVSPRRMAGATLNAAERFCTATGGLVTEAADTDAPEFSSAPVAPALSWKVLPSGALAVNVQVNTCVPPPPMAAEAPAGVPPAAPEGCTDGGSGVKATLRAGAWPLFVTASETAKDCPGATDPGSCSQLATSCAGVCTRIRFQATSSATGKPLIGSEATPLTAAVTRPGEAAWTAKWNVRVPPTGTSWGAGGGPLTIAPGPETRRAAKVRPTASRSPELVTSTARSNFWPTLTVAGTGAGCAPSSRRRWGPTAPSTRKGPAATRRRACRCAPQPRSAPRSWAKARRYVPAETSASISTS